MPNTSNQLGIILKKARENKKLTRDQLSEKIHISSRYLMAIENENKKPSYDVLFSLIRELEISADKIFYPENKASRSEQEILHRLLSQCNRYELNVAIAAVRALLKKGENT